MKIMPHKYAFFDLDQELKDYCERNLTPWGKATLDRYDAGCDGLIISHTGHYDLLHKKNVDTQRPFLPKKEFYAIQLLNSSELWIDYVTHLYQEMEDLKELNQCQLHLDNSLQEAT